VGSVLVLLGLVLACFVCVQFGAIALELTGMDRSKARFQALSAFTNSGFTTRETEEVMRFVVRRRIISTLMITGYAGLATVVGTIAQSLFQPRSLLQRAGQLGVVGGAVVLLYLLARWTRLTGRVGDALRAWLTRRHAFEAPSVEEMLLVFEGFGVVRASVDAGNALVGRPLSELRLTAQRVQILAIHRGTQWVGVPQGHDVLRAGDELLCYGDEKAIESLFGARTAPS
jgi:hypothetical protein